MEMDNEFAHNGAPKRERYSWTITNEPGEFLMIDKSQLRVDHRYQRPPRKVVIQKITREWDWAAFGVLCVSMRKGSDDFFVFDGQHRLMAAKRRDDVQLLPCMVFELVSIEDEAKGFLTTQCGRKPVTSVEKYNAAVMMKDETAMYVKSLVDYSGREVSANNNGTNVIGCISLLMSESTRDRETLARMWPIIVELCEGERMHKDLIAGLLQLERSISPDATLTSGKWKKALFSKSVACLNEGVQKARGYYGTGTPRVCAEGIANVLNHGKQNKLAV